MANIIQAVKRNVHIIIMLLPILSFIAPFLILYSLQPWTFEQTYHGRTFLLFFLWLVVLEIILSWEKLQKIKVNKLRSIRTVLFVIALLLPTIYVVAANYYGINIMIHDLTSQYISPLNVDSTQKIIIASYMKISIEFLVFAVLFCLIILLTYGISILGDFSISTFFLGIIGVLFTIDYLYPQKLTPLQIFVPATATLAAKVLTLMGYQITSLSFATNMPFLSVTNRYGQSFGASIDWACAGVESLLIYSVTILLFLKETAISWKQRIVYFVIGGAVTYFINILRIVTIFLLAMDYGYGPSTPAQRFHDYYGMLYSITWIVSYPLIIIATRALWGKIRNWKIGTKKTANFSTRTNLSD